MIGLKNVRLVIVIYDVCMHHPFFTLNKINLLFKRIRCIFSWPILHRYDCFARKVVEASINKCIQQGWNILLKIYMYFKNIWPIIRIRNIWVLRDIPLNVFGGQTVLSFWIVHVFFISFVRQTVTLRSSWNSQFS